jgi:glucan phosphoethanolaminetransferase (alkaline phosphatase superfamily)
MVKKVGLLVLFGLAFVVCILGNFPWYTKILAGLTMLVSFIIVLTTDFRDLK